MKISDVAKKLGLEYRCTGELPESDIQHGYAGDLLSDVLAHAKSGALWFTIQRHKNILAVATAKDVAGIVIVNGVEPEERLIESAEKMGIPVFTAKDDAFICSGRLYSLLNNGH